MLDHAELRTILSNLSHELCRPLVSLRAGFDLLLGGTGRTVMPEQHGHLQTMIVLCDDMLRLTRSYLDYAGLVQGGRPLHFGTYTLGALIRDIDHEFSLTAASRKLAWECALEGEDATVITDASRCQQVFGNLVANALKYTPASGSVRVTARHEGDAWFGVVADTGPGIPAEACTRVFEPFYRLSREDRAGIEGSGLGLAICREMVEQMAGEITISSEVGRGTRVTVRLPVKPPDASTLFQRLQLSKTERGIRLPHP
ncbi:MAG TPA: HAMP domain-containing sensor histidine kinase [Isosphaeraceae bacterium]|jgi:signal transduction histidine kinase|nr:HAMP domain-containing sensor histidine kinase [Isosphaeraceae bacterium]